MTDEPRRIAGLLTCHNRRELTLRCLDQVRRQTPAGFEVTMFLVDDGSTDGTGPAVRERFPDVVVVDADGSLFWNKGMHLAWSTAIEQGPFDFYLMLNDDTFLRPTALADALARHDECRAETDRPVVVVGTTVHPETREITYGGYVAGSRWNGLKLARAPADGSEPVVTMNGNFVLMSAEAVERVGIIDERFAQSFGDIDLGYRATKAGVELVVTAEPVGECEDNPTGSNGYLHGDYSLRERLRHLRSVKGLNGSDWYVMSRRHGGPLWPLVWLSPHVNVFVAWGRDRLRPVRSREVGSCPR